MKSATACAVLSLSSLLLLSNARPLTEGSVERRKPASYSVVAVGGGSTEDSSATATVTDAVTKTQTVMQTQLSTVVVTASNTPTTIVFTVTTPSPTTVTDYPPAPTTTELVSVTTQIPASSEQSPSASPPPATSTETTPPATITVTQPLPSTRPYDDEQWHTVYYYTVSSESSGSTTSAPTSTSDSKAELGWSSSTSAMITAAPSPTFGSGSWHRHGPP